MRRVRNLNVRDWVFRVLAVFVAAGFLGTGAADAFGLHRCPHHDGLPGEAGAAVAHAGGAGAADGADHGGSHAVGVGEAHAGGAAGHGDHGPCTCVGACGLTGAAHPVPRQTVTAATESHAASGCEHAAADAPSLHADYILPFANAPPSVD